MHRSGFVALLLLLFAASSATAQAGEVSGRALRVTGTDTVPLSRASVVLHRLSAREQGPIDSVLTSPDGRFRFRAVADSEALLLASTRYSGIEYFSRPTRLLPGASATGLAIMAADTSSRAPVNVAARYLVVSRPGPGGVRGVLDLIVLQNRGGVTRVAPDTASPALALRLPPGLSGFEVGDGEISPAAIDLHGDTLTIASPLPPGERQLIVTYMLPSDMERVVVPLEAGADSAVVLLEEGKARVTSPGFRAGDTTVIDEKSYRRWMATNVPPGEFVLRLPAAGRAGPRVPVILATVMGVVLLLAAGWILRRPRRRVSVSPAPATTGTPAMIIERLALLDREHAGREAELGPEAWSRYLETRASLQAEYEAARRRMP